MKAARSVIGIGTGHDGQWLPTGFPHILIVDGTSRIYKLRS